LRIPKLKKLFDDKHGVSRVLRSDWDALTAAYAAQPTSISGQRIPLTDKMRSRLLSESERTKLGYKQIHQRLPEAWQKQTADHVIRLWLHPNRFPKTVFSNEWDAS